MRYKLICELPKEVEVTFKRVINGKWYATSDDPNLPLLKEEVFRGVYEPIKEQPNDAE